MDSPLPLFPLTTALVPGLVLPLHIFEPRYRLMIEELLTKPEEDREFGIVAARDRHPGSSATGDATDQVFPVGVTARLRHAERLDDGRYDIVTIGGRRFRITGIDASAPLWRASVEFLPEPDIDPADPRVSNIVARATAMFDTYRSVLGGRLQEEPDGDEHVPTDPAVLSYLITAALIIDAGTRQELLASSDAVARLQSGMRILGRETALIAALGAVPAIDLLNSSNSVN